MPNASTTDRKVGTRSINITADAFAGFVFSSNQSVRPYKKIAGQLIRNKKQKKIIPTGISIIQGTRKNPTPFSQIKDAVLRFIKVLCISK
ncbi:MAG: hypothetical protein ABIX01_08910 [Chitinophagaceae bacterium]